MSYLFFALIGASDTVSTIIRQTLRQTLTPDRLRGRMTGINQIFFMGGPQLGELEAGMVAAVFGVPFAIVSGGIATVALTGYIAWRYPRLRRYTSRDHGRGVGHGRAWRSVTRYAQSPNRHPDPPAAGGAGQPGGCRAADSLHNRQPANAGSSGSHSSNRDSRVRYNQPADRHSFAHPAAAAVANLASAARATG